MKHFKLFTSFVALVIGLTLVSFSFAQDSTKVKQQKRLRDGSQAGDPVKDQKRQRLQIQDPTSGEHGPGFVDENGDGYNDNAPDHDGDGIPNGLDPDYTGSKNRSGKGTKGFVDADGDGINDNVQAGRGGKGNSRKGGYGPGDGTGNKGIGPKDGTGNGSKTGGCDGTGPKGKGNANRGSKK